MKRSHSLNLRSSKGVVESPSPGIITKVDSTSCGSSSVCVIFDLIQHECIKLSIEETLITQNINKRKPCLLYLKIDSKDTIEKIFNQYKLNPLIQSECCEWSFKEKDYVMNFDNFFFIAISDCLINEDIENPMQIKMLIFKDFIIVITSENAYFVESLFKNELKYKNFPSLIDPNEELCLITGNHNLDTERVRSDKKVSIEDCSHVDTILHKMLETMIYRYESILFALLVECRTCICYSTEISYKERVEYLVRVSVSEKSLIYLSSLVRPKVSIMKALLQISKDKKKLRPYLKGLNGRIRKMNEMMENASKLLLQAKILYMACSEESLRTSSFSAGNLMKFYSGLTTLFLPPALMTGMWGTNIMLPGGDQISLEPFTIMMVTVVAYFAVAIYYLKRIDWL